MLAIMAFNLGKIKVIKRPTKSIIKSSAVKSHDGCSINCLLRIVQMVFAVSSPSGKVASIGVLRGFMIPAAEGLTKTILLLKTREGTFSLMTSKNE